MLLLAADSRHEATPDDDAGSDAPSPGRGDSGRPDQPGSPEPAAREPGTPEPETPRLEGPEAEGPRPTTPETEAPEPTTVGPANEPESPSRPTSDVPDAAALPGASEPAGPPPQPPPDLPSYPRTGGPRAARRAAADERRRVERMSDEHGLPTYPRERRPVKRHTILDRLLVAVLALAALILIAYVVSRVDPGPPPDSALVQAIDAAGQAVLSFETNDPAEARRFVRDEFGWAVGVPLFGAADLRGVGIGTLAPVIEVPVFFYQSGAGQQAVLFALSYALLDQVPDRVRLSRADYDRLAEDPTPRVHRIRGRDVALWRDRADIYVLISDIPTPTMVQDVRVVR